MEGFIQKRRRHSADLKARVLEACAEPGASVAGIAMEHGLNANLVHKWRRRAAVGPAVKRGVPASEFIALPVVPKIEAPPSGDIRISIRRGNTTLEIAWPVASAMACAQWLREVLR